MRSSLVDIHETKVQENCTQTCYTEIYLYETINMEKQMEMSLRHQVNCGFHCTALHESDSHIFLGSCTESDRNFICTLK
jgi:hypothetical protein